MRVSWSTKVVSISINIRLLFDALLGNRPVQMDLIKTQTKQRTNLLPGQSP